MGSIIFWVIFGGIVGWVASLLVGKDNGGLLMNILVGIVGSVIGGAIFNLLGGSGVTGFNVYSVVVGIIGAIVLLGILQAFRGKN